MKIRDAGLALSLANLLFYPVWAELLPGCYGHYYLKRSPGLTLNLGILLVVLGVALLLWVGILLIRGIASPTIRRVLGPTAFLIVFLVVFNGIRSHLLRFTPPIPPDRAALVNQIDLFLIRPALLLGAFLLLTKWRDRVLQGAKGLVLVLLPFVVVTFSQAAWVGVKSAAGIPFPEFSDQPSAPLLPLKPGASRVLWFLFDGSDQRLAFSQRPDDLDLPHLDRLQHQAIYATAAHSPATNTRESLPALLTGVSNSYARPLGANDLLIQVDNTAELKRWSTQPNVFSKARALGCNTALVGYYHPYCRVIGRHLSKCFWTVGYWSFLDMDNQAMTLPQALSRILKTQAHRMTASIPFVWRLKISRSPEDRSEGRTRSVPDHIQDYLSVLREAREVVADPSFQLVFVHWPIPHHPNIYDRRTGQFSPERQTSTSDNLALVDRTIGEMRTLLEAAGLWESTALVVTSDHSYNNQPDREVPFLLKLPGQKQTVLYEEPWNTVVISDLVLDLLSGKISNQPQQVISWLNQHRKTP